VVLICSDPEPANELTRSVLAGLLPGPDFNQRFFDRVGTGLQFSLPGSISFGCH
jgi:hypothetical protein